MNKVEKVKEAVFGNDVKYAIENFNGLLWNDPDKETIEKWIDTPFKNEYEEKEGIEIAVADWFDDVCDTELTDEERDATIDLITDDIFNYHEEQYEKHNVIYNETMKNGDYKNISSEKTEEVLNQTTETALELLKKFKKILSQRCELNFKKRHAN